MRTRPEAVIITGSTHRIGCSLAQECLFRSLHVIAHYRTNHRELSRWLQRNPRYSKMVHFIHLDLADQPHELILNALKFPVRLRGLINNASCFTPGNLRDQAHLHATIDTNTFIPAAVSAAFAAHVSKGWIVNITDAHSTPFSSRFQNYRMSKRWLADLTAQMALLYAPAIRVNAVAPGAILPAATEDRTVFSSLKKQIPLQRTGDLESVRRAVGFLIDSSYVTGQTIYVDGGWHLCS